MSLKTGLTVVLLLLVIALSFAVGHRWKTAAAEAANAKTLRLQVDNLRELAEELAEHAVDNALAYQQATERMDAIAALLEAQREANRTHFQAQASALAALLEARPDLDVRLGPDVLHHWNRSNAGPGTGAAPAAPEPAGSPAHPVSSSADGDQRPAADPAGEPRPGGAGVSRLLRPQPQPAERGGRMGDDCLALVLRCGGPAGHRVPGAVRA